MVLIACVHSRERVWHHLASGDRSSQWRVHRWSTVPGVVLLHRDYCVALRLSRSSSLGLRATMLRRPSVGLTFSLAAPVSYRLFLCGSRSVSLSHPGLPLCGSRLGLAFSFRGSHLVFHSSAFVWSHLLILRLSSGPAWPIWAADPVRPRLLGLILGLRLLSRRLTPSTSAHQRVLSRIWLSPGPGKLLSDYSLLARWLAGSPARLLASPLARWLVCSLARPLNRSIARSLG